MSVHPHQELPSQSGQVQQAEGREEKGFLSCSLHRAVWVPSLVQVPSHIRFHHFQCLAFLVLQYSMGQLGVFSLFCRKGN